MTERWCGMDHAPEVGATPSVSWWDWMWKTEAKPPAAKRPPGWRPPPIKLTRDPPTTRPFPRVFV